MGFPEEVCRSVIESEVESVQPYSIKKVDRKKSM